MKLLLGLAGTEESERALDEVIERAATIGDDLTVAVVERDGIPDGDREATRDRAVERCEAAGVDADVRLLSGHPGSTLVELAESGGYDRLIIGGGTESPMGKIELGPVTEFVLLNAQVTVTLVR
jgi:nucleotide-binding universal stress UspA family protein